LKEEIGVMQGMEGKKSEVIATQMDEKVTNISKELQ